MTVLEIFLCLCGWVAILFISGAIEGYLDRKFYP